MADYTEFSEEDLLNSYHSGDPAAFAEIYKRYCKELITHMTNKIRDRDEARDIVQDVFTILLTKRDHFQITNLRGFLFTTARNLFFNSLKHKDMHERNVKDLLNYFTQQNPCADDPVIQKEFTTAFEKHVFALPYKMREIFELSRFGNMTHREIATMKNITEATVSRHISSALKILRTKLAQFFSFLL